MCAITISLTSLPRGYLPSIQDTKLILLKCFSQCRFQHTCALGILPTLHLPLPHLWHLHWRITSTARGFSFPVYTHAQLPVSARIVLSCQGVAISDLHQIPGTQPCVPGVLHENPAIYKYQRGMGLYSQPLFSLLVCWVFALFTIT